MRPSVTRSVDRVLGRVGRARDVVDPTCLIAVEVLEDQAALDRQEQLPEVAQAMKLFESGALVADPEYTIYEVSSVESPS